MKSARRMWRAGAAALSVAAAAVLACDSGTPSPSSPAPATPSTTVVTSRPCDVVTGGPDGRVRLYVCAGGIESYISANAGRNWTREGTVVSPGTLGARIICDPSWVPDAGLFIFKIAQ